MDQYLLIPLLVGWTSIYQLFWCSLGVQGFDTLPYITWLTCGVGALVHQLPGLRFSGWWLLEFDDRYWSGGVEPFLGHPKNDGFIYVYTINHMNICMNKRIGVLYWLVVWNMNFMTFPSYWEFHHPSWRSHIFQRGRYTTNQWCFIVETSSKIWIWG